MKFSTSTEVVAVKVVAGGFSSGGRSLLPPVACTPTYRPLFMASSL